MRWWRKTETAYNTTIKFSYLRKEVLIYNNTNAQYQNFEAKLSKRYINDITTIDTLRRNLRIFNAYIAYDVGIFWERGTGMRQCAAFY